MSGTDTGARAFSVEEYRRRLAAVRRAICDRGLDAVLVNLPAKIATTGPATGSSRC